jgi:hypothetical protein
MSEHEDFDAIVAGYGRFKHFLMHATPVVAVIYGAVAWKPYFFFLGLAAIALFWLQGWMEKRHRPEVRKPRDQ